MCNSACSTCLGLGNTNCQTCATGYYNSSGTCLQCDVSCATCTGGLNTNCQSCNSGYYLQNTSVCNTTCPATFYADAPTKTCKACSASCVNCLGATASNCSSCASNKFLAGTTCTSCPVGCLNCSNSTYCYACSPTFYFNVFTNLCYSICPAGTYADAVSSQCLMVKTNARMSDGVRE